MLQHFIGVWFSQFSYCRLNPSRSPNFKSTRPPANHSLFRYCWQTPWLWDSKIAIHHIQEETATEDRIFIMNLATVFKLYLGIKNIRLEESLFINCTTAIKKYKGADWIWTSNLLRNEIEKLPLMVSQLPPVVPTCSNLVQFDFQQKHPDPAKDSPLHRGSSTKCAYRGWLCIAQRCGYP